MSNRIQVTLPPGGNPWQGKLSRPSKAKKKDSKRVLLEMPRSSSTGLASFLLFGVPPRRRNSRERRTVSSPTVTPAPQVPAPAPTPAPVVAAPVIAPAPEPVKVPEPTSGVAPAAPEAGVTWTQADDEILMKMKADKKSWAEIGEVVKGKDKNELRERYKELLEKQGGAASAQQASQSKAVGTGEKETGKKGKGKGKEGKGAGKGGDGGKGKHMISDDPPNNGRPRIYFDEEDGLDIADMELILDLSERFEAKKWTYMASKFFDKTGKRVDPKLLKQKLSGIRYPS